MDSAHEARKIGKKEYLMAYRYAPDSQLFFGSVWAHSFDDALKEAKTIAIKKSVILVSLEKNWGKK